MKKNLLAIFICCAFCCTCIAQVGTLNAVQQPLTPDVAGLGKYIELPIGHYTGVPEIGIPLYELKTKDLAIPVSLSYHASGIKRREIPGMVGAGFSLNAGGVITRIIRGYSDGNDMDSPGYPKATARQFGQPGYTFPDPRSIQGVVSEFQAGKIDGEFDQFYFNFMGYTGSFTFTNEGKLIMNAMNNIRGEYHDHHFKMIDENGIEYHFNDVEVSSDYVALGYISVWYLSKIVNPFKNELVTFNYEGYVTDKPYVRSYGPPSYYTEHLHQDKSPAPEYMPPGWKNPACEYNASLHVMPYQLLNEAPDTKILKEIIYKTDTIKFYRGHTQRSDLFKVRLDSISVFSGNKVVHRVGFKYTYSDLVTTDSLGKKMLLDSVKINDQSPYGFEYIGSYMGKNMPGVYFLGEDLWGYYNGEDFPLHDDGTQVFSRYKIYDHRYVNTDNSSYRNPDYKYAQIGSLKSVTYPTGGKTEFEYEGNDFAYSLEGELEHPDATLMVYVFDSLRTTGVRNARDMTIPYPNPLVRSSEVIIHHDQTVNIRTSIGIQDGVNSLDKYMEWVYNDGEGYEGTVRIKKFNPATGDFDLLEERSYNPVSTIGLPANELEFINTRLSGTSTENHTRFLTEGRYRIEAEVLPIGLTTSIKVTNVFRYMKPGPVYTAGGLRIKKVKFTSPQNGASFEKKFDYSYKGKSSGIMESIFSNVTAKMYWGERRPGPPPCGRLDGVDPQLCTFYVIHHENMVPLGNAKGGVIGYAQVTESLNDGSKKVMQFTNGYAVGQDEIFDFYADGYNMTYLGEVPIRDRKTNDYSGARGKMKLVEYYKGEKKIKKEIHKHQFMAPYTGSPEGGDNISIFPVITDIVLTNYTCNISFEYIQGAGTNVYFNSPMTSFPTIDSVFYFNGLDTLREVTYYNYNGSYTYPSMVTKIGSAGDTTTTYYRYPFDYAISGTVSAPLSKGVKNLLDKHVVSRPVETYVKRNMPGGNSKVVEAQLISFKPDLPFPDTVYTLKNTAGLSDFSPAQFTAGAASIDNRYERKLVFSKYQQGDVVEQHKEGDAKEVLLWGYRRRHIVARVLSSDFNTVIALVDTNVLNNPSSDGALRTELHKIRTGLASSNPKAKVTSYTYDPLIGMTSMTDPRGEIMYYEYDKYGRLKRVKDVNGDLKKNNWYHYKP